MAHWETIQDRSSYISQVRIVPPKNHSVERGNGIFEGRSVVTMETLAILVTNLFSLIAVSKSSISITTTKTYISHTHRAKKVR